MLNTQPALHKVNVSSIDQTLEVKIIYKNALRHAQSWQCAVFLAARTQHHPSGAELAFLPCLQSSDTTQLTQIQIVHVSFSQQ